LEVSLADARHWVFDMDGTLTIAVHDFVAIKRALNIPEEDDILHHLAALPAEQAASKRAWLHEHERELADAARPAVGARELLRGLRDRGCTLGVLTRNDHSLALVTLQAVGLGDCFASDDILGRDEAPPKPDPAGLLHLAEKWGVEPQSLVMVGDFRF
jgi:HAD superfamily hydrolase (TIGR01509 family)